MDGFVFVPCSMRALTLTGVGELPRHVGLFGQIGHSPARSIRATQKNRHFKDSPSLSLCFFLMSGLPVCPHTHLRLA